jgi:hypothetical protein
MQMTNYIDDINNQFNTDANLKSLQAKSLSQYDVSLLYSKKKKNNYDLFGTRTVCASTEYPSKWLI